VPLRLPFFAGLNDTEIVHPVAVGSELGQLFVCGNSVPLLIDEIETAVGPVFERVTFCAALVVPTTVFGKFSDAGKSVTEGPGVAVAVGVGVRVGVAVRAGVADALGDGVVDVLDDGVGDAPVAMKRFKTLLVMICAAVLTRDDDGPQGLTKLSPHGQ